MSLGALTDALTAAAMRFLSSAIFCTIADQLVLGATVFMVMFGFELGPTLTVPQLLGCRDFRLVHDLAIIYH